MKMNRTYVNKKNAQQTGYDEGVKFLNSWNGFHATREEYEAKGRAIADTLYSQSSKPLFITGWMNAWEARHAKKSGQPKTETPKSEPKIETQPTFTFTNTLSSALAIFDFSTVPAQRALILKYRDLAKVHHPDHGGLHLNMVAINRAYDYIKKFY
jgi:hypothetical protein